MCIRFHAALACQLWLAGFVLAAPTFNDVVVATVPTSSGGSVTLKMDIFKPAGATTNTPVVVWIHGGGWGTGSYNAPLSTVTEDLLNQGIAIAQVSYRFHYEGSFPVQIQDVKAGIRHLRANAATYGIDSSRIAAWGSSAGGHLSALLTTSGGVAELEGAAGSYLGTSSRVMVGADYFGPTDLLNMNLDANPPGSGLDHDAYTSPESKLIGFGQPGQGIGVLRSNQNNPAAPYPELMHRVTMANPITHVDANDPMMFIAHGTADSSVPLKQSTKLHNALDSVGVPNTYLEVLHAGHGVLGDATNATTRAFLITELTRPFGDATRDDAVNFADLLVLAQNYGSTNASWRQGDFTTDGNVNSDDLLALAPNYYAAGSFDADWQLAQSMVHQPPGLAGDYNGNGVVDASDFVLWRHTFGQSATTFSGADGNGNGSIDVGDYGVWRANFGRSTVVIAAIGSAAAIPEPTARTLLLLMFMFMGSESRRSLFSRRRSDWMDSGASVACRKGLANAVACLSPSGLLGAERK